MIVLAFDSGLADVGWSLLEFPDAASRPRVMQTGTIAPPKHRYKESTLERPIAERLAQIGGATMGLMTGLTPDVTAVESYCHYAGPRGNNDAGITVPIAIGTIAFAIISKGRLPHLLTRPEVLRELGLKENDDKKAANVMMKARLGESGGSNQHERDATALAYVVGRRVNLSRLKASPVVFNA